MSKERRL